MTINFTKEQLAAWLNNLKELAKADTEHVIHWFGQTAGAPLSIVGGWKECFADSSGVDDLFCCSKSHPKYCMCVKIAENDGPYAYTDYEIMDMPYDRESGDVENTEVMLEWNDPVDYAAEFFMHEWERLMDNYIE